MFVTGKATVMPFTQSIADTRLAGAFVAKFVNILKDDFQYAPQRIHIISHRWNIQITDQSYLFGEPLVDTDKEPHQGYNVLYF